MAAYPDVRRTGRPRRRLSSWCALFFLVSFVACENFVRCEEPPAAPKKREPQPAAKPEAAPAAPAQPAPAVPAKPPAGAQIQIQVQGGQGGGKIQINGGIIQVQGNAKVQVQANGNVVIGNAAAPGDGNSGEAIEDTVFRSPDRALQQRLTRSEELIAEGRYAEAVEMLGGILEQAEDYFFRPSRSSSTSRSLKAEAQRQIGALPPAGRDAYELQYGIKAKQMLEAAVDRGDEFGLAETSRRYFHTQAGLRATYLLGLTHLDHGRPLAAALCWRRLRELPAASEFEPELSLQLAAAWVAAGQSQAALDVVEKATGRFPGAVFNIGGEPQRWQGSPEKTLAWLAQLSGEQIVHLAADDGRNVDRWLLVGGSATRNAVSPGSNPLLNRRWAVPYVNHPDVEKLSEQLARGFNEQAVIPLPASQPLALNDVVLMRTFTGLTAVDFRTGKRIWRGATDEHIEQLLQRDAPLAGRQDQEAGQLAYLLEDRVWRDAAYGTFSSDGKSVFCIEEAIAPNEAAQRTTINFNGRRIVPGMTQASSNRLAAYDLATEGKLLWELGGGEAPRSNGSEEDVNSAERILFLGPPLPMGDRLYVLGESKGEIRLYVLHAATGKIDWSQQLALAPEGFDVGMRRSCGLSPSYADGVLLCPTTLGAVVAVDLNDRSLLWGFQYKHEGPDGMSRQRMFVWQMQQQTEGAAEGDKWHDALLAVSDGKVLIAPPDGDQLTCLSLLDGSKIWEKPRNKGLYVACVHDGKAIVIAGDAIRAFEMKNGAEVWTRTWPEPAKPSGRGFSNGRFYFAPLSTAEVAAIDLGSGQIAARSKSRSGTVPGNLVCYHGAVLSQGVNGLECFYQLEELRREVLAKLKERPDDPQALSSQGELLLDEGKIAEAIEVLRKSHAAASDPRTRNLLIDALLEGLGSGLVSSASDMDDLEKLASGTLREESYLRLRAEAHERAKDDRQALAIYLRLIDLPGTNEEPLRKTSNVSIGRARWVKAKLKSLSDRADPAGKKEIFAATEGRRQAALASSDLALMRNYLEYFGDQAAADEVRLRLAEQTASKGNLLEAEMLYSHVALGSEPTAVEAAERLARLFVDSGRPADAVPSLRRLQGELASVKSVDGKTGDQVAAPLVPKGGVEKLSASHAWPVGKVDVVEVRHQANSTMRSVPLEFRGPRGPYFENLIIEMEQTQQQLVIRDADGVERQRITLVEPAQRRHVNQMNPMVSHLRAVGHLLIVSLGHEIVAIDTLSNGPATAKILWRHDLADTLMGVNGLQNIHPRVVNMPWGVPRFMAADGNGRAIGTTGPATTKYVSYLRQRTLNLVDPLTGKTLWVRNDIDPGSDLFGDEEYLFVTPTNNGTGERTWVLRVADGEKLKEVRMPRAEQRVAAYGRRLLTWAPENGKMTIKLLDALEEKTIWSQTFTPDARLWPIASDEVAVFTRAGKLAVLSVADGAKRLEATVIPEPQLSEAYVLRTSDAYLLITNSPLRQRDGVNIQPVPGGFGNPLINGYVYGFDRKTQAERFKTHVQGQGLTLNQPADLPVLIFASQIYEQPKKGQMRQPEAALFVVDKRNGRVVYDKRMPAPLNMVELTGETARNVLQLRTLRNTLQFTFTDEPIQEESPKGVDKKADDQKKDGEDKPAAKVGAVIKPSMTVPLVVVPQSRASLEAAKWVVN